jgi:hypothetical protein
MMDRYFCESTKATGDQSSEIATTASMEPIISLVCFIFIATEIYLASTAYSYMKKRQQQLQRTTGRASSNNNSNNNTELSTIPTPLMVVQEEEDDFLNQVGYLPSIPEDPPDRDNEAQEGQT